MVLLPVTVSRELPIEAASQVPLVHPSCRQAGLGNRHLKAILRDRAAVTSVPLHVPPQEEEPYDGAATCGTPRGTPMGSAGFCAQICRSGSRLLFRLGLLLFLSCRENRTSRMFRL